MLTLQLKKKQTRILGSKDLHGCLGSRDYTGSFDLLSFLGFLDYLVQGTKFPVQLQLIEQLYHGVKSAIVEKLEHESEADFKLRRFTVLCEIVIDLVSKFTS